MNYTSTEKAEATPPRRGCLPCLSERGSLKPCLACLVLPAGSVKPWQVESVAGRSRADKAVAGAEKVAQSTGEHFRTGEV